MRLMRPKSDSLRYTAVSETLSISASARCVWNFTASTPASAAASTRAWARAMSPSWLMPASAMMKTFSPVPRGRLPIVISAMMTPPVEVFRDVEFRFGVDVVRFRLGDDEQVRVVRPVRPRPSPLDHAPPVVDVEGVRDLQDGRAQHGVDATACVVERTAVRRVEPARQLPHGRQRRPLRFQEF